MSLLEFDKWWWICFNSFVNNYYMTKENKLSVCYEILDESDITKEEVKIAVERGLIYGKTVDIINEYLER